MKRLVSLLCLLTLSSTLIFAQSTDNSNAEEQKVTYEYIKNYANDQYLRISLAPIFSLDHPNLIACLNRSGQIFTGGMGSLGYGYFLTDNISLGGTINFSGNPTIGSNIFNVLSLTLRGTYHPTLGNFEFPITAGFGLAHESYSSKRFVPGLVLEGEAGVHYRINTNWAAGIDAGYMYLPQWTSEGYAYGQFLSTSVVVRYYF